MPTERTVSVCSLFSGSSGNGIYIGYGTQGVLIDAGCSAKATREALLRVGAPLGSLRGIFVTHEHIDHVRGIEILSRTYPVHLTEGCAPYVRCCETNRVVHPPLYTETAGDFEIRSFVTPHDSRQSVGYIVRTPDHTVGIATDLGHIADDTMALLCACDSVILESNYDDDMLMRGPYPFALKQRIASDNGHLSNRDCAAAVLRLARSGVRNILLAHLSEENNTPELAYRASESAIEQSGCRLRLAVADRRVPTRLV